MAPRVLTPLDSAQKTRFPSHREATDNRKDKKKINLENFWNVIKDYKLPMSIEEVDIALQSR